MVRKTTAQTYYMLSLRSIQQAGSEHRLYGVGILADMARQMLDLNRHQDALDISRIALDSARTYQAPAPVLAMLRTREGWSYAGTGRAESFRRTVGQAEDLLGHASSERPPEWARGFDHAELSGVVGARYRDLAAGQQDRAARHAHAVSSATYIDQALRLRDPAKLRNRAFDLVGLGRTYLLLDEPGEAARMVSEAATIERMLGSGRVQRRLRDWHREAASYHRDPGIAEVRDELLQALPTGQPGVKEKA